MGRLLGAFVLFGVLGVSKICDLVPNANWEKCSVLLFQIIIFPFLCLLLLVFLLNVCGNFCSCPRALIHSVLFFFFQSFFLFSFSVFEVSIEICSGSEILCSAMSTLLMSH